MPEITFKTYNELEISEGLTESSHVIIEENGDVKRFPANSIGKVKTVNGAEPDENGNVAIEISGGSASSWEELGSKYTESEPVILVEDSEIILSRAYTMSFYAIGSLSVNLEEMGVVPNEYGTLKVTYDGTEYTLTSCGTFTYVGEVSGFGYGNGSLINNTQYGAISDSSDTGELLGIVLESDAVHLCMDDDYIGTHTLSLTYYGITETVTQIPEKYVPTPSIAPVEIVINTNSNNFVVGDDTFSYPGSFGVKAGEVFNNGHKLYGELVYLNSSDDEVVYYITDAVYIPYAIYANAIKAGSYTPYLIRISSSSVVIYNPDGTEEYRKDYEEE